MRWGDGGREGAGRQGRGEPRQGYEIFQERPTQETVTNGRGRAVMATRNAVFGGKRLL